MVERIRTLLESRQLTPTQFADSIGVARPIVSHILSGRNKPSLEVVQRILAAMPDLAMPWLLNGTGPMLVAAVAPAAPLPEAAVASAVPLISPMASATAQAGSVTAPAKAVGAATVAKSAAYPPDKPVDSFAALAAMPAELASEQQAPVASSGPSRHVSSSTMNRFATGTRNGFPAPPHPLAVPKRFTPKVLSTVAPSASPPSQPTVTELPVALEEPSAVQASPATAVGPGQVTPQAAVPQSAPAGPATAEAPTISPSAPLPTDEAQRASLASALFGGTEKPIRRIVIFYRDGSFADYQPE